MHGKRPIGSVLVLASFTIGVSVGTGVVGCGGAPSPDGHSNVDTVATAGADAGKATANGRLVLGGAPTDGAPGFVDLADGQDVSLVPGSQGGFHILINARLAGFADTARAVLERQVRRETTGELVSRSQYHLRVVPAPVNGWQELESATPVFLCPTPVGIAVADEMLVLHARAQDEQGPVAAESTLRLRPRCPSGEQERFCRSICSG